MKTYIKQFFILFIVMCCFSYSQAVIIDIKSVEALEKHFEIQDFTDSDMVVFDVDMVLTMPQEPAFQGPSLRKHYKDLALFLKKLSPEEQDLLLMHMVMGSPQTLTHKKMLSLVSNLQQKKIIVLALTALLTGRTKDLPEPLQWRTDSLLSLGFDFQTKKEDIVTYTNFLPYLNGYPKRSGKLLLSNGDRGNVTKGMLLVRHLNEQDMTPLRLVMVDDRRRNLEEVSSELQKYFPSVEFIGVHYLGAFTVKTEPCSKEFFLKKVQEIYRKIQKNRGIR